MKNLFKTHNFLKSILLIAIIMVTASQSNAQQGKPIGSGYAPVNDIKVYYEVYGEHSKSVLQVKKTASALLFIVIFGSNKISPDFFPDLINHA